LTPSALLAFLNSAGTGVGVELPEGRISDIDAWTSSSGMPRIRAMRRAMSWRSGHWLAGKATSKVKLNPGTNVKPGGIGGGNGGRAGGRGGDAAGGEGGGGEGAAVSTEVNVGGIGSATTLTPSAADAASTLARLCCSNRVAAAAFGVTMLVSTNTLAELIVRTTFDGETWATDATRARNAVASNESTEPSTMTANVAAALYAAPGGAGGGAEGGGVDGGGEGGAEGGSLGGGKHGGGGEGSDG
jgi:hypothetical protein